MNKEAFCRWLVTKMKERGIEQGQLAAFVKVSHVTVGNWMKGTYLPKSHNMAKLAEYFHVDLQYLMALAGQSKQLARFEDLDAEALAHLYMLNRLTVRDKRIIYKAIETADEEAERERQERKGNHST
jgi:transcriptional regulator with XRE-family HTH domain